MSKKRLSVTIFAAGFYLLESTSAYGLLAPMSLSQMYGYASKGDVRTLRLATQRGLNIDTVDRHGNTGLCYAILSNNVAAYNSFKAAGANPRHGCTQNIPRAQYNKFMAQSGVYQETQTSREAYRYFNKGEYVISPTVWWVGGALLAGAGAALAFSGGGGGGGGSGGDGFTPTNDSLGTFAGNNRTSNILFWPRNADVVNTITRTITNDNK